MKNTNSIKFFLLSVVLMNSLFSCSQKNAEEIKCYALKDSFVIKNNTKLVVTLEFIYPQGTQLNLGSFIPESNGIGGECISTEYKVMYRSSLTQEYTDYIFDISRTQAQYSKNSLEFSTKKEALYAFIPDVLYQKGDYKFKFILHYSIGGKMDTVNTQWINVEVLK